MHTDCPEIVPYRGAIKVVQGARNRVREGSTLPAASWIARLGERVRGLCLGHGVAAVSRVLDLRTPPAQRPESVERSAELGADDEFDGHVMAAGLRPQALLGEQRDARLAGRVVGQDVRRFRVRGCLSGGRFQEVSG